jgi:hypothetical protein
MSLPRGLGLAPLAPHGGLLVEAQGRPALLDIPPGQLREWLGAAGIVLFRGFDVDRRSFAAFASGLLCPEQIFRPGDRAAGHVQPVDAGQYSIPYHAEHACSPLRPDLLLFHCVTPPPVGGETTVCDGIRLLERLSPRTRALFLERRLRFCVSLPAGMSRVFLDALGDDARRRHLARPGAEWRHSVGEDGAVRLEYVVTGAFNCHDGRRSLANALIPQFRLRNVAFEDGPVPAEVVQEIEGQAAAETMLIAWRPQDVAVIDNSRMMHGRRAFRGERVIDSTFGRAEL